jgi:two-component system chemotaxis sensor kinase CheA
MEPDFGAILQTFAAEAEENLRTIDEGLVVLETQPGDAETLATIFRMAHTIKGNAASLGFPTLTEFAHAFEEILDLLRKRVVVLNPALTTLLLESVDAVRLLVATAIAGESEMSPPQRALLERLVQAAQAKGVPVAPPPQVPREPLDSLPPQRLLVAHRATLRVDVERLDKMLDLVGEMVIERSRMRGLIEAQDRTAASLLERYAEADGLYAQVQELVLKLRMVSIGPLFRQQVRAVRDVAQAIGKQARLVLEGEDEEMDTAIIDHLKDALTHMIRNALDHGIEAPEARIRSGKDPHGTITLRARHEGGGIVIQIADDGGGLRRDAIVRRAREMELVEAEGLDDNQLFALIFEPGFSTAPVVTDVSGRGVGMDVVMKSVKALRGTIGIASTPGKGTTFTIRLPLTVAMIEGFAVTAGSETYVVPLESVSACMELPPAAAEAKAPVLDLRGSPIPFFRLRDVFKLSGPPRARESLVLLEEDKTRVGLAVDGLLGVTQVVIKSPGKLLAGRPGVAGSTILGTGRVAFILDVPGLLRMAAPSATPVAATP